MTTAVVRVATLVWRTEALLCGPLSMGRLRIAVMAGGVGAPAIGMNIDEKRL